MLISEECGQQIVQKRKCVWYTSNNSQSTFFSTEAYCHHLSVLRNASNGILSWSSSLPGMRAHIYKHTKTNEKGTDSLLGQALQHSGCQQFVSLYRDKLPFLFVTKTNVQSIAVTIIAVVRMLLSVLLVPTFSLNMHWSGKSNGQGLHCNIRTCNKLYNYINIKYYSNSQSSARLESAYMFCSSISVNCCTHFTQHQPVCKTCCWNKVDVWKRLARHSHIRWDWVVWSGSTPPSLPPLSLQELTAEQTPQSQDSRHRTTSTHYIHVFVGTYMAHAQRIQLWISLHNIACVLLLIGLGWFYITNLDLLYMHHLPIGRVHAVYSINICEGYFLHVTCTLTCTCARPAAWAC